MAVAKHALTRRGMVADRPYVLNAERAREEQLAGKAADSTKGGAPAKKGSGKKKAPEGQGEMF